MVNVVELPPGAHQKVFEVRFYRDFQVEPGSGGTEFWGPVTMAGVPMEGFTGSEFYTLKPGETNSPFVKFRMELLSGPHPAGVAARARIIETRGSKVVTHTFLQYQTAFEMLDGVQASVKHWQMNRAAEGQVVKYHKKEWETATLRQERRWTLNRNDVLMEDETWREEDLFLDGTFVLTRHTQVTSPNNATPPLVTQYSYGQVIGDPGYKKQVSVRYPDGGWVRYRYSDPADPSRISNVPWVIFRPWGNSPANPNEATISNCQVERRYFTTEPEDGDVFGDHDIIRIDRLVAGQKIAEEVIEYPHHGRSHFRSTRRTTTTARVAASGGGYDAQPLTSMTFEKRWRDDYLPPFAAKGMRRLKSGRFVPTQRSHAGTVAGRLIERHLADGSRELYTYSFGAWDPLTRTFNPNGEGTHLRTTVSTFLIGDNELKPGWSRSQVTIEDRVGRVVHDTESLFVGSGGEGGSQSYWMPQRSSDFQYDAEGNLTRRYDHGDLALEQIWTDQQLIRRIDEQGVETELTYNSIRLLNTETRLGVNGVRPDLTTTYQYDTADRVQSITRSAVGVLETESFTYDMAGRKTSQIDALGRTTSWIFDQANRTQTETRPDGSVVTTARARDGSTLLITEHGHRSETHTRQVTPTASGYAVIRETVSSGPVGGSNALVAKAFTETGGDGSQLRAGRSDGTAQGGTWLVATRYGSSGRVLAEFVTGSPTKLFDYDAYGRRIAEGLDLNGNGVLDRASNEPITLFSSEPVLLNDTWWEESETLILTSAEDETTGLTQKSRVGLGGNSVERMQSISSTGEVTEVVRVRDRASRTLTETTSSSLPGSHATVRVHRDSLLVSEQHGHGVAATTTFTYDAMGRTRSQTSVAGTSTWVYDDQGRLLTTVAADNAATQYTYYPALPASPNAARVKTVLSPGGQALHHAYGRNGKLTHQWGLATYPQRFEYDVHGRLIKLYTYQSGDSSWDSVNQPDAFNSVTPSITTWNYHVQTGALLSKTDAMNRTVSYGYDAAGRPTSRTWARGVVTSYTYSTIGKVTGISYSDGTPAVGLSYDRAGRPISVTDASGVRSLSYDPVTGAPIGEVWSGPGLLSGWSIERRQTAAGLPGGVTARVAGELVYDAAYHWDDEGERLERAVFGFSAGADGQVAAADAVAVNYNWQAQRVKGWRIGPGAEGAETIWLSQQSELGVGGRLEAVEWRAGAPGPNGGPVVSRHVYELDAEGRRQAVTRQDGRRWEWDYDSRGQVTAARGLDATGVARPGLTYAYAYDAIGNRLTSGVSSPAAGSAAVRSTGYAHALDNSMSGRENPGFARLRGVAVEGAVVEVNGPPPVARVAGSEEWGWEAAVNNSSGPVWRPASMRARQALEPAQGQEAVALRRGNVYVPPAQEVLSYDADGNLTADGRWTYTWDGENRLVAMETTAVAAAVGVPRVRLAFVYDADGRRISKRVWLGVVNPENGGAVNWQLRLNRRFGYDGWNMVAEFTTTETSEVALTAMTRVAGYAWGLDLSGTLTGTGGVGGLVAQWRSGQGSEGTPAPSQLWLPCYDGNGNVTEIVAAGAGTVGGQWEYSAFGETVTVTGAAAAAMPFRFSTKYTDGGTGLVYYGYRYYAPEFGRWLGRDPIEEEGGLNLFGMVGNDAVGRVDRLGLELVDLVKQYVPKLEGAISFSFTWIVPIAPPAVTFEPSVVISGEGKRCCDKKEGKYKLLIEVSVEGEASIGMGTSVGGAHYAPKGRGSKWRDTTTGQFRKKPKGGGPEGANTLGDGEGKCPDETFEGTITVGVRGYVSGGLGAMSVGAGFEISRSYSLNEKPATEASAGTVYGKGTGARIDGFLSVGGSVRFLVPLD
jgi:RHS repeat-associated protein